MLGMEAFKRVLMLAPQVKNNGAFAGNTAVDTIGAGSLSVEIAVGATDVAVGSDDDTHPLKLEECDTVGGQYSDIDGAALAAVIGAGDDGLLFSIALDLRKTHKRFVRVKAPTAGNAATGANLSIVGVLGDLDVAPDSAAECGLEELVHA